MQTSILASVELFCGIGGFRIAADRIGLRTVWANDISPLACAVYRDRFGPSGLHEGDINFLLNSIPHHDVLLAGFPCQPFSAAGKKEGVRDSRGTLFQTIVDILQRTSPRYFILENVKRLLTMEHGAHFATILSALSKLNYLIEWRVLNARDFGLAQNRERVVIIGQRLDQQAPSSPLIHPRLANAADIASGARGVRMLLNTPDLWKSVEKHATKFPAWGVSMGGKFFACDLSLFSEAQPTVTLNSVLEASPAPEYDYTPQTLARMHLNEAVNRYVNGVEIISNQAGGARMGYTIFGIGGLAPTLTASTSRHYERYQIGDQYRRLTPHEYARLQGFPDEHCRKATAYDQYALLGNAAPPPMIEWVLNKLIKAPVLPAPSISSHQPELFDA